MKDTDIAHAGQVWLRLQEAGYKGVGVQVIDGVLTLLEKPELHDEIREKVDLNYHENQND